MATTREIALYAILILFGWLSYLVIEPFLAYVIFAFLFAFLFYPLFKLLNKVLLPWISASLVLVIVLLCIIIPSVYLAGTLIAEATSAYQGIQASSIPVFDETAIADLIERWTGLDLYDQIVDLFRQGGQFIAAAIPSIITSTGTFLLGLFIFFFVLYFALRDGPKWYERSIQQLPIRPKDRIEVGNKVKLQAKALLYGQLLTSILVGVVVAVLFALFGVPNPVFWGFLMVILGIIPVVGAFVVYIPAGIFLIWQGNWISGIALIVLSVLIHVVVDNILRPQFVSKASEIHPIFVIIGALGGIALMGIVGFLVGPLILSFFVTILAFDKIGGKKTT